MNSWLNQNVARFFVGFTIILMLVGVMSSCGSAGSSSSASGGTTSKLGNRALVSNSIASSIFSTGVYLIDAHLDKFTRFRVSTGNQPTLLAVSKDKKYTLIYDAVGQAVGVVDNVGILAPAAREKQIASISVSVGNATSLVVSADDKLAYVAEPDAPVLNGPNGVILLLDIDINDNTNLRFTVVSRIPFAGVNKLEINSAGDRLLAFGQASNTVAVIDTTKVVITAADNSAAATMVAGFDRPVDGTFATDGKTAYIFSCGAECGGTQANVSSLDTTANSVTGSIAVDSATVGFLSGSSLYVAGAKPQTACPSGTAAAFCGQASIIDTGTLTVKTSGISITDGFHDRIETQSNKLFIGANHCSDVNTATETRGCLSILDTTANAVVISPDRGSVTGIAPIGGGRTIVYVIIGNELRIYDSSKSALIDSTKQLDFVGGPVDVKYIDN